MFEGGQPTQGPYWRAMRTCRLKDVSEEGRQCSPRRATGSSGLTLRDRLRRLVSSRSVASEEACGAVMSPWCRRSSQVKVWIRFTLCACVCMRVCVCVCVCVRLHAFLDVPQRIKGGDTGRGRPVWTMRAGETAQ